VKKSICVNKFQTELDFSGLSDIRTSASRRTQNSSIELVVPETCAVGYNGSEVMTGANLSSWMAIANNVR
jgi:hypothetical protein